MSALPVRYRRTVVTNYMTLGVQLLTTVVMTPVLVNGLGKTGYGVWSLVLTFVLYLQLLEFGFAKSTTRAVAQHEALGDRGSVRRVITTSVVMLTVPGLAALAGGLILAAVFSSLFDLDPALAGPARVICVLFAFAMALSIPSDTFGATLAGLQRYDLLNATRIATTVAEALGAFLVLRLGGGLVALGAVTVAIGLGGQLGRLVAASRLVGDVLSTPRRFDRSMVKPLASGSVWFFVAEFAQVVVSGIDTVVVGLVIGVPEAAVYAVALKLALLSERAVRPATVNFFPATAALSARADRFALLGSVTAGTRISLGLAMPLCLVLVLLARPTIEAWVGPDFADAAPVVVFLAAAGALRAMTGAGVLALQGMGYIRYPAIVAAGEAVLNLVLSVLLASTIGIGGVALATLLAAAIAQLAVVPYLCQKVGLSVRSFLLSLAKAHVPALAAAGAVGLAVRGQVDGIIGVAAGAVAISGTYVLVFAFTGVTASERRNLTRLLVKGKVRSSHELR